MAITNSRIIKPRNNQVTFTYKNSKTDKTVVVTVNALEFIRRFLQHVLPYQFIKVRYYGFYASVNKEKLNKLRKLLFVDEVIRDKSCEIAQKYVCCHICGCAMIFVENIMIDRKIRSPLFLKQVIMIYFYFFIKWFFDSLDKYA